MTCIRDCKKNMPKPDFFIIGAPKCGTTSLSKYLRSHPNVCMSALKEPNYFAFDLQLPGPNSLEEYLGLFSNCSGDSLWGEASTHYLCSQVAVPEILKLNPNAKFIVMLRNPVEMAESLFFEARHHLAEKERKFERAWKERESRSLTIRYDYVCDVGNQLERLYNTVSSRDLVHVIHFDNFIKNTAVEYRKVLNFLNLPDDGKIDFTQFNKRKDMKSRLVGDILRALESKRLRYYSKKVKDIFGLSQWPLLGSVCKRIKVYNLKRTDGVTTIPDYLQIELYEHFLPTVNKVKNLTSIDLYGRKRN